MSIFNEKPNLSNISSLERMQDVLHYGHYTDIALQSRSAQIVALVRELAATQETTLKQIEREEQIIPASMKGVKYEPIEDKPTMNQNLKKKKMQPKQSAA